MRPQHVTEQEFAAMVEKVRGSTDARRTTGNGSRRNPANHKTSSRRGESTTSPILPREYRSKLEAQYAAHLELLRQAGEIRRWAYEPMSLVLSNGSVDPNTGKTVGAARYRPDFLVVLPLGAEAKAEMHEVKGRWTKNRRDGMTHLKWAAQLYGDVFTFRLIEWKGHGFDGHYIRELYT